MSRHTEFGQRFKTAVELRYPGLTQQQVGERLGVSHVTVSQWGAGNRMPGTRNLTHIAKRLAVNHEWLATGRGNMLPSDSDEMINISQLPPAMRVAVREMVQTYINYSQ